MPNLQDLVAEVKPIQKLGNPTVQVEALTLDSRQAAPGVCFFALRGAQTDGHRFIPQAEEAGVAAIVLEEFPQNPRPDITYVLVADSGEALGKMASAFYGHPSRQLHLIGVTGTNGKTTTVTLLHKLFLGLGYQAGLISTVQNQIGSDLVPSTHTTPDAINLNQLLSRMVKASCTHCFMEVSSHAMVQKRVAGIHFAGGIFTNITHDHLDYHGTFDAYLKAKKSFFDILPAGSFALVNADDKRSDVMLQNTAAARNYYGLRRANGFKARILDNTLEGLHLEMEGQDIWFKLIGTFNAYNLLAVYGAAVLLKEDPKEVLTVLSGLSTAAGRFDYLISKQQQITGIVDYAHTPDALENVLATIQQIRTPDQRIITVVGCGGNRDAAKRPLMAEIACRLSDQVLLTSDNPRFEEPQDIIREMEHGVKPADMKKTLSVADRREAIKTACALANPKDIVLVAGKGHETYQEIKGQRTPFDDKQVLREMLELLQK
jgi:UDP-N-acetylmuramoyl-L-alanyl-D-glutamate--2,6-diaminopimelate ligase